MESFSLGDSSADIELIHPIRLDDIESGVHQSSQNSFYHLTQLAGVSTPAGAYYATPRSQSFISMQLTYGNDSTDDCMDIANFAIPSTRSNRIGSAPAITHCHDNAASLSLEALITSPIESLEYNNRSKHIRCSGSPISAGSNKNTPSHKTQLDPPTNTPSVSGKIYRGSSPVEGPVITQSTKYLAQLSRHSSSNFKKNDSIYTMTKIPQTVCFTSASLTNKPSEISSFSPASDQVQYKQSLQRQHCLSPRSAPIRQDHKSPGLYPLSYANKFLKETSYTFSSRPKFSTTNTNYTKTPTMQLKPSHRSKSPKRPTTVTSFSPPSFSRKPNSSKRTNSPISNTPPVSPNRVSATRPGSHLIVRSSPLLKLGGALNSPYSSLPIEFPLQIRSLGHAYHKSSTRGASIPNTPDKTEITIHKDKRFRPVSPDGNTFITIFSPTINNPNNPVTFHINETTLVTKTSVGWIKLNNNYERRKNNSASSPQRPSTTNKFI